MWPGRTRLSLAKLRLGPMDHKVFFGSGSAGLVRYLEDFRQNDQKNQELSFRAQREIFCFDGVTNAEDFSLRSK